MLDILIQTVPKTRQRYDTVGDWFYDDGRLVIRIVEGDDWHVEFAIAIHELVESALCRVGGITQQQVDYFDFESSAEEPGDDPAAPYHREHVLSNGIEQIVLALLKWRTQDSISSAKTETGPASPSG